MTSIPLAIINCTVVELLLQVRQALHLYMSLMENNIVLQRHPKTPHTRSHSEPLHVTNQGSKRRTIG